jgi:hypothetical protein
MIWRNRPAERQILSVSMSQLQRTAGDGESEQQFSALFLLWEEF